MAVLRNKELWSENRLQKLDAYTKDQIGKKFNSVGMYKVPKRKVKQDEEVMQRVDGYFEGSYKPPAYERNTYFCSELVTSAFIHVGIIDEPASILLRPDTFSPENIGRDKAFGFLWVISCLIMSTKFQKMTRLEQQYNKSLVRTLPVFR